MTNPSLMTDSKDMVAREECDRTETIIERSLNCHWITVLDRAQFKTMLRIALNTEVEAGGPYLNNGWNTRASPPIESGNAPYVDPDLDRAGNRRYWADRAKNEPTPIESGRREPVAWRWHHVNDDKHEWRYQSEPIKNHNEYLQVEPLFADAILSQSAAPPIESGTREGIARIIRSAIVSIKYAWEGATGHISEAEANRLADAILSQFSVSADVSLDNWIEREFSGYGLALRRKNDAPIEGEPFMSMATAKELTRRAFSELAVSADVVGACQRAYDFLQDKSFTPDSLTHECTKIVEQLEAALASIRTAPESTKP